MTVIHWVCGVIPVACFALRLLHLQCYLQQLRGTTLNRGFSPAGQHRLTSLIASCNSEGATIKQELKVLFNFYREKKGTRDLHIDSISGKNDADFSRLAFIFWASVLERSEAKPATGHCWIHISMSSPRAQHANIKMTLKPSAIHQKS